MNVDIDPSEIEWAKPKMFEGEGEYKRYENTEDGVSELKFPPSKQLIKWNSYEHDEKGYTTEDPKDIKDMHDKRRKKNETLIFDLKERKTVYEFGKGEDVIFTFGSTTMSVREAVKFEDLDAKIVQPVYMKPFPIWELEKYIDKEVIVVEQNSTGQFAKLLREKCGIKPKTVIRKYDGRAFEPRELADEIKEAIR